MKTEYGPIRELGLSKLTPSGFLVEGGELTNTPPLP